MLNSRQLQRFLPAFNIAFWISPRATLIQVMGSHIGEIIENPERFGWTLESIERRYLAHREPMPVEGRAREEIICSVLPDGWIRIRNQRNYWSVTVHELGGQVERHLLAWLKAFHDAGIIGLHADLKIHETLSGTTTTFEPASLLNRPDLDGLPELTLGITRDEPVRPPVPESLQR